MGQRVDLVERGRAVAGQLGAGEGAQRRLVRDEEVRGWLLGGIELADAPVERGCTAR